MSDVFISYSRTDRVFVRALFDALEARGSDAWVDWADIDYAEDWWLKICSGIEAADNFVFIVTPESVRSKVCFDEIEHAVKNNKRIIPVLHREVTDKADKQRMHPAIARTNWLPFVEDAITEKSLSDLLDTLRRDPEHVHAHTRLLVRAREWEHRQRNPSLLLRGNDLDQAEEWLNAGVNKVPVPTNLHAEYIYASRRAQRRFQRNIMTGVSVALVVAILLSVLSFTLYQRADAQLKQTTSLLQVADAQLALENKNQDLALALALRANQVDNPSSQAKNLLASLAYMPGTKRTFSLPDNDTNMIEVAISPDQKTIATINYSGSLVLWDAQSGQMITTLTQLVPSQSYGLVFSSDNRRLYSGNPNGHLLEWDLTNNQLLRDVLVNGGISSLALTPDDDWLLIGTFAGEAFLWHIPSGEIYFRYSLGAQDEAVKGLTVNNDATRAGALVNQRVVIWDIGNGEIIRTIETNDYSVTISSDFEMAVTADEQLHVWNLETGELLRTIDTSQRAIQALAFSPDNRYILSGSIDGEIVLWSVDTVIPLATLYGHHGWIWDIDYSLDGSTAVSASWEGETRWWNIKNPQVEHFILPSSDIIVSPVFSTVNRVVAYANSRGDLESMYLDTGKIVPAIDTGGFPISITYSPDGVHALGGINTGELYYWDTLTGEIVYDLVGHRNGIQCVAISPDGRYALAGDWDNRILLWDLQTGLMVREFQSDYPLQVAFDHQGSRFLSVSDQDGLVIWDIASGETLLQTDKFKNGVFSPDDASILSRDGQVLVLWGIQTQNVISRFTGHVDRVVSATFNEVGTQILSGAADGRVILWDVATGQPVRQFTEFDQTVGRVAFGQDGNTYWASSVFAKLYAAEVRIWHEVPLDDLVAWIHDNRYVYPLNCDELKQYNQCQ